MISNQLYLLTLDFRPKMMENSTHIVPPQLKFTESIEEKESVSARAKRWWTWAI